MEHKKIVIKYIDYLKAGNSDYPLNVIRKAGVDMEKEDYLNAAFEVFERRLNEFEALVEKIRIGLRWLSLIVKMLTTICADQL